MPANALNSAFVANPANFINNANHSVIGHDDLLQATTGTRDPTKAHAMGSKNWKNAKTFMDLIDAAEVIAFDFVPYSHGARNMVLMTPVAAKPTFTLPSSVTSSFCQASTNPVVGYWFPYKVYTPQQHNVARKGKGPPSVMGWVDIPMNAPAHSFAFTGSMQGCHLVITLSPKNPLTHFRVYHYASPGTTYKTSGNMAFINWPSATGGRICYWFDDTQYENNAPAEVDAFNFLHHDGTNWYIHTQKQKRHIVRVGLSGFTLLEMVGVSRVGPIPTTPVPKGRVFEQETRWRNARGKGLPG